MLCLRSCFGSSLMALGTVCSSWVVVNQGTSRRSSLIPGGDPTVLSCRKGNKMVTRTVLIRFSLISKEAVRAWGVWLPQDGFGATTHFLHGLSFRARESQEQPDVRLCVGARSHPASQESWYQGGSGFPLGKEPIVASSRFIKSETWLGLQGRLVDEELRACNAKANDTPFEHQVRPST